MRVPFNDLHAQYLSIKKEIDDALSSVIAESAFIRGSFVDKFERNFSRAMETEHCVSCANGTDALYIAMKAFGVKSGDEVIVPAHSWISTSETVSQAGASVVFCDTDKATFTIDANLVESKITEKTVGIIPVHLFGQAAEMDKIMAIAKKFNLWVIEDCAQAHLTKFKNKKVGTFGDVATFSFYPGKNLGAMGDAGAIITNNAEFADRMAMFARHGGLIKGQHIIEGINSRLDGLQAAILNVKLRHLEKWTEKRVAIAETYINLLSNLKTVTLPNVTRERKSVWHLFVIKHDQRDMLAKYLKENGIDTVINYPIALPFLPAYKRMNSKPSQYPNAYSNQSRILSLPIFPEMTPEMVNYVVEHLIEFEKSYINN